MGVIADLKAHGVSIIFISHRLNEIKRCADRVVVLRDGKVVGELARDEIDPAGDDPPDDRPRSEIPLYPAPGPPPARPSWSWSTSRPPPTPAMRSALQCAAGRSWASPASSARAGRSWPG
jgi:ABC-type sugar transport system, ATPase component